MRVAWRDRSVMGDHLIKTHTHVINACLGDSPIVDVGRKVASEVGIPTLKGNISGHRHLLVIRYKHKIRRQSLYIETSSSRHGRHRPIAIVVGSAPSFP